MAIYDLDKYTDMQDWIDAGKQLYISNRNMAFRENIDGKIVIFDTVITRYIGMLNQYITTYTFTDKELEHYKFMPKLYCQEIYETPELWSALLYINNMVSATQFNKKTIKTFTSNIITVIEELMMLNEKDLEDNEQRLL